MTALGAISAIFPAFPALGIDNGATASVNWRKGKSHLVCQGNQIQKRGTRDFVRQRDSLRTFH